MCTGYLAFAHYKLAEEGGLRSLNAGCIGVYYNIIDPDQIPDLDIFDTTDEMLEAHDESYSNRVFG